MGKGVNKSIIFSIVVHNKKKNQSLDMYKGENERKNKGYILFLFVALLSLLQ